MYIFSADAFENRSERDARQRPLALAEVRVNVNLAVALQILPAARPVGGLRW